MKLIKTVFALALACGVSATTFANPLTDMMKDTAKSAVKEKVSEVKESAISKVTGGNSGLASVAKININKADLSTLQQLSGIGGTKAKAIIDYRNKVGKFKSAEDLLKVPGIGEATLEKIKPFLSF